MFLQKIALYFFLVVLLILCFQPVKSGKSTALEFVLARLEILLSMRSVTILLNVIIDQFSFPAAKSNCFKYHFEVFNIDLDCGFRYLDSNQ